ncbi:MAG TPA: hypothetical protein VF529_13675 [Solirubrobacteraceae bacterium]|jgi:hypothetical protein
MNSRRLHTTALAAVFGGAVYVFTGAIQATHDFEGTHNTIDTTAEYLVTGALPVALFATLLGYRAFGALARRPRAAGAAIAAQAVLAVMCVISVINGEDASFFNAVAPICLLTWLVSSIVIAVGVRRHDAVPRPVAIALPILVPVTFILSPIGGPMITGAFWLTLATHVLRDGSRAVPAAA